MAGLAPYDLTIDFGGDLFLVSGRSPRLSWKLPATLAVQTAADIEMVIGAGEREIIGIEGSDHLLVGWPARSLRSGDEVRWRVRSRTESGASPWSEWHAFEAGLFDEDWTARWISPVEDERRAAPDRPAHLLTGSFVVRSTVRRARLYATALGLYEAFVNSERAGTVELAPGSTSYDHTLYAQASDVTAAVHAGANTVEILLSDGWFRGRVGAFREPAGWGTAIGARLELHLHYADGSTEIVGSDGRWTCAASSINRADLMDGQASDLRASPGPGRPVLVDAVSAPPIDWSPAPPVRCVERRPAMSVTRLANGAWIADFGQNASGAITLSDLGPPGTRTVIDYGEHLDTSGDLTTSHLDSVRPGEPPIPFVQRDEVVSSGGQREVFEPRHTVHGFRYARLDRGEVPLDVSGIVMRVVQTDLRPTGTFACSVDDLNRLHDIADWSFRGNAVDVPTDCPTRERLGWTGDYQVFAPTAVRLYDVAGFSRKWLGSVRDDQLPDGRIANFSPDGRRIKLHTDSMFAMLTGSAGWGDAIVLVPWLLYETYGDRDVLAENWDAMARWVEWELATARTARHPSRVARSADPEAHEEFVWDGSFHWGEWIEPKIRAEDGTLVDPVQSDPTAWFSADKGEVGTAYLFRSTSTLSAIARVLGRDDDAARYGRLADRVRDAWRIEFLDGAGRTVADTQASYVRALSFGLVPEEQRKASAERLVELIRDAGTHLRTGLLSTADLLPVLADAGYVDVAYEVLFQRTSPSWLGMLDRGATTIWEDWDGIDANGMAHDSLNHYSKGAVVRFLHTHTVGLRQAEGSVAWESFVVAPVLHEAITWARGTFDSPQGTIEVEWHAEGDELLILVEVPPGSTATVVFPGGKELSAGPGAFSQRHRLVRGA